MDIEPKPKASIMDAWEISEGELGDPIPSHPINIATADLSLGIRSVQYLGFNWDDAFLSSFYFPTWSLIPLSYLPTYPGIYSWKKDTKVTNSIAASRRVDTLPEEPLLIDNIARLGTGHFTRVFITFGSFNLFYFHLYFSIFHLSDLYLSYFILFLLPSTCWCRSVSYLLSLLKLPTYTTYIPR